jgi:hypothetical protein
MWSAPGALHRVRIVTAPERGGPGFPRSSHADPGFLADPEQQALQRLLLDDQGTYWVATALTGDVSFAPDTFEGFALDLGERRRFPGLVRSAPGLTRGHLSIRGR